VCTLDVEQFALTAPPAEKRAPSQNAFDRQKDHKPFFDILTRALRQMGAPKSSSRLFVYGTLMPGQSNFSRIKPYVLATRPGETDGILVDLGSFPALLEGDGVVRGVLLEMEQAALRITDGIEGYHGEREGSLYWRKEVTVRLESGEETVAWTYFFARPKQIADRPRPIVRLDEGRPVFSWRGQP